MNTSIRTQKVRSKALELGFDAVGFSRAVQLDEEARRLEEWLNKGYHGTMRWMENHFEKRINPRKLVPDARSVVSVICNYYSRDVHMLQQDHPESLKLSKYAQGEDYHTVLKERLYRLYEYLGEINGGIEGRVFVDSAPVMDKAWAARSGLGWIGKHTNIIRKGMGSWFFIGEMITDAEFDYDAPATDHCGTCTRCIDACPTGAIFEPYKLDANRCISYLTIELREAIPDSFRGKMENWIFGCDICQDVCPWNRKASDSTIDNFRSGFPITAQGPEFWEELDLELFEEIFRESAVKRTKFEGLKRNIRFAAERDCKKSE